MILVGVRSAVRARAVRASLVRAGYYPLHRIQQPGCRSRLSASIRLGSQETPLSRTIPIRRAGYALLLLALSACATRPAGGQTPPDTLSVEGEHGLYVTLVRDTVRVHFQTAAAVEGWVEWRAADGSSAGGRATPRGTVHVVTWSASRTPAGEVVLSYGARDSTAAVRHHTTLRLTTAPPRPSVEYQNVDSIFVVSDVHGELVNLKRVLENARVIDASGRWTGGRAHLVVLGDMVDRGSDATGVLWFLYGLEAQAERAGGKLDVMLGNHELMVMTKDLRYLSPKEQTLATAYKVEYDRLFDPRRSLLGSWLVSKPAMIKIDGVLFAHGGVSADYLRYTLQSFDDSLAAFMKEDLFYRWADRTFPTPKDTVGLRWRSELIEVAPNSRVLTWYREYAEKDADGLALTAAQKASAANGLTAVLGHFGATLHVIGHTPLPTITQFYDGRVIDVNTVPFGAEALLLVRRGNAYERWRYKMTGLPERIGG
jgi:hypothetical protein